MEYKEVNWKQIIITILLTGIVTLASSLIIDWYKSEEPKLIYSTTETLPFEGKENYFGIYHIKIENQGKNPISDLSTYINIPDSIINDKKILIDPAINYSENLLNDTYSLQTQYINPKDVVEISLLVTSKNKLPSNPILSVRGKGINGILQSSLSQNTNFYNLFLSVLIGMTAFSASIVRRFKKEAKHSDDQKLILAYLCRINGLTDEANKYLESLRKIAYWAEADNLGFDASKDNSPERKEKIKKLLTDIINYAGVVDSSKGIIYYNIAVIEISQGNFDQAINNLKKAREFNGKIIDSRLKLDPLFSSNSELLKEVQK